MQTKYNPKSRNQGKRNWKSVDHLSPTINSSDPIHSLPKQACYIAAAPKHAVPLLSCGGGRPCVSKSIQIDQIKLMRDQNQFTQFHTRHAFFAAIVSMQPIVVEELGNETF